MVRGERLETTVKWAGLVVFSFFSTYLNGTLEIQKHRAGRYPLIADG
jgi:hypothetical protein